MMSYSSTRDTAKKYAEVFTPAGLVFKMILFPGMRELLREVDRTVFDPCVGWGQFPCSILVLRFFYNIERLDEDLALRALKSLYGMDIQEVSVDKCREHLLLTLQDAYRYFTGRPFTRLTEAQEIIQKNFWQGDSLAQMKKWASEQGAKSAAGGVVSQSGAANRHGTMQCADERELEGNHGCRA